MWTFSFCIWRTLCIPLIRVFVRQLLQVVFKQHLISRDSLHRLQHVMLQRQAATDLLTLLDWTTKQECEPLRAPHHVWVLEKMFRRSSIVNKSDPWGTACTCISRMMALNWGERSLHCLSSSMALSKFFTYSAYILRKGVNLCRMSPMRGVDALEGKQKKKGVLCGPFENWVFSSSTEAHHSSIRFSRSGSRNWLWKAWMDEMLEKIFFTTSTGKVPLLASSINLEQNTYRRRLRFECLLQDAEMYSWRVWNPKSDGVSVVFSPGPAGEVVPHTPSLCAGAHWRF